jgi:hypothetical protein
MKIIVRDKKHVGALHGRTFGHATGKDPLQQDQNLAEINHVRRITPGLPLLSSLSLLTTGLATHLNALSP